MAVTFGYEYFKAQPDFLQVEEGLAIPWCKDCHHDALLQAVGIIGAIIMPHNLYLHSALVKSRQIDRNIKEEVKDANRYVFIESAMALGVSLIINIAVTAVFAHGLFGKTSQQILEICLNSHNNYYCINIFPNSTDPVDVDLFKGGVFLGCEFGIAAMYIWAIGLCCWTVSNDDRNILRTICHGRLFEFELDKMETSCFHKNNCNFAYFICCNHSKV